jgi:hypothetical protein
MFQSKINWQGGDLLGYCKLEWITFDQFFESLKICFTMYFLHAKNCKVIKL